MKRSESQPLSLAARIIAFVGLAIGLSFVLLGIIVLNGIERHFAKQDAGELAVVSEAVINALRHAGNEVKTQHEALSRAVSGHHGVYFQVLDRRDRVVFSTPGTELSYAGITLTPVDRINADNLQTWQADHRTFRGGLTRNDVNGSSYSIITAIDMDFHLQFLRRFRPTLWLIMSLAGALTLLAAWYGVYQAHAPLRRLSNRMGDIQADRLHVRLAPSSVPLELQDLVVSFNHMIGRLEDSFTRLSHFSADIAHELRTPLTNVITQTQVGLGKARSAEEYRELLYSNLEEQERLAKMVNDMLWLAKSEHGLIRPVQAPLDLAVEVGELFEFFEALAEERHIQLALEGNATIIEGDRGMLRRAISNLLSNAIRHTPANSVIKVSLASPSDDEVLLSVQNPGTEITAAHLPHIFDRFYRVDPSRSRQGEGAGLGLAIVRSIVEAHGGRTVATSTRNETTFMFTLPTTRTVVNDLA